jgi:hypothetical protein
LPRESRTDWYRYYAGYSANFVEDVLDVIGDIEPGRILDPWNGSGTTTAVARGRGVDSTGYDINPALVLVARSRLLSDDVADSIDAIAEDLVGHAESPRPLDANDPLVAWFTEDGAATVRALESAIRSILVSKDACADDAIAHASPLAALYYVALFKTVRKLDAARIGTNPTWRKVPVKDERVDATSATITSGFRRECSAFKALVRPRPPGRQVDSTIRLGSSRQLGEPDGSFGAVIASPPYLTRIDYAVATRLELAVLGMADPSIRSLRDAMIGTPTMVDAEITESEEWGPTAKALLDTVTRHVSRASGTYYRKYFLQYLSGMVASLAEIRRVVAPAGSAVLVVQDSYYKEVYVDLPRILIEMGERVGFPASSRIDFDLPVTKAAINRGTRAWRSSFSARESVIQLSGE